MTSPTAIAAYLALFAGLGLAFLAVNLLVGKLVRPDTPTVEKSEIYECGEPTIGSSFVQFDLRFYVVALLFIIFDVEVAFFFPWATVFGKTTNLSDPQITTVVATADSNGVPKLQLTPAADSVMREMGIRNPLPPPIPAEVSPALQKRLGRVPNGAEQSNDALQTSARRMGLFSIFDIGVFFAVLLVGFAYVWKRGDLDWVRAVSQQRAEAGRASTIDDREPALTA